ncbi:MAG: hypothetical protein BWX92_04103 [Deltaproteobacteria bacterium ADurb.Bin135]|nr:MAG: hypothetical protein BWX92_04103 [Deltaproteobacteria bacterium ADurb.Bin135]
MWKKFKTACPEKRKTDIDTKMKTDKTSAVFFRALEPRVFVYAIKNGRFPNGSKIAKKIPIAPTRYPISETIEWPEFLIYSFQQAFTFPILAVCLGYDCSLFCYLRSAFTL